jgi:hypothetical protein
MFESPKYGNIYQIEFDNITQIDELILIIKLINRDKTIYIEKNLCNYSLHIKKLINNNILIENKSI